ncbi:MAG: hypothetical protein ACK5HY_17370 [Parahaliea sp.]
MTAMSTPKRFRRAIPKDIVIALPRLCTFAALALACLQLLHSVVAREGNEPSGMKFIDPEKHHTPALRLIEKTLSLNPLDGETLPTQASNHQAALP